MRLTTVLRVEGLGGRAGGWELDEEVVLDVGRVEEEVEEV